MATKKKAQGKTKVKREEPPATPILLVLILWRRLYLRLNFLVFAIEHK